MGRNLAILFSLTAAGLSAGDAFGQQALKPYEAAVRAAGIDPTQEALGEYLKSLIPNDDNREYYQKLVDQLGDADFATREAAEATLASLPNPPLDLLREAAESDDPETRYRARHVLAKADEGGAQSVPNAVLGYIAHNQVKGLTYHVLQYLPYSGEDSAYGPGAQAVRATVAEDDLKVLRRAIEKKPPFRRAIATLALADVLGEKATDELLPLLEHEDAIVRLAAAESLANLGERQSLATLVVLLSAEDLEVRSRAASVLRSFTHENFQFVAYDSDKNREPAVLAWRKWLSESGDQAELHFPLKTVERFLGRTLMSMYPSKLREIDAKGNKLFETDGFQYIWGCHATEDGTRVVVDFSKKLLIEYNPAGKESLRLPGLPGPPSDVRRLDNGQFLLALSEANKVVEMDRDGRVTWSVDLEGRPTSVNRLDNGNTLVNLQFAKKAVEIDRAGKIVWELPGLNNVLTAQALPNGNVLVCEMNQGKAVEYNRAGKVVWEKRGFRNACQAQRIPNGNTLVSDSEGLQEFDPAGDRVWSLNVPRGRFWRY